MYCKQCETFWRNCVTFEKYPEWRHCKVLRKITSRSSVLVTKAAACISQVKDTKEYHTKALTGWHLCLERRKRERKRGCVLVGLGWLVAGALIKPAVPHLAWFDKLHASALQKQVSFFPPCCCSHICIVLLAVGFPSPPQCGSQC